MLQSHTTHQWSANGLEWLEVDFYDAHNGGSAVNWPRDNGADGDERGYLPFWGVTDTSPLTGGCCSSSTAVAETHPALPGNGGSRTWGHAFTLSYAVPLQPPPPNTGMSLVADVAGTTLANDAFWAEQCKTIPSNTLFIVLDMGSVRDFFKPSTSETSYCEMLQSSTKHQWSADGLEWKAIPFHSNQGRRGGSAVRWLPQDSGAKGDARVHLSFWGRNDGSLAGGCCSSSTAVERTYTSPPGDTQTALKTWGQPFALSYAVPITSSTPSSTLADASTVSVANTSGTPPNASTVAPPPLPSDDIATTPADFPTAAVAASAAVLIGIAVAIFLWRKRAKAGGNNQDALGDGGATLEMVQNPMWKRSVDVAGYQLQGNGGSGSATPNSDGAASSSTVVYATPLEDDGTLVTTAVASAGSARTPNPMYESADRRTVQRAPNPLYVGGGGGGGVTGGSNAAAPAAGVYATIPDEYATIPDGAASSNNTYDMHVPGRNRATSQQPQQRNNHYDTNAPMQYPNKIAANESSL